MVLNHHVGRDGNARYSVGVCWYSMSARAVRPRETEVVPRLLPPSD